MFFAAWVNYSKALNKNNFCFWLNLKFDLTGNPHTSRMKQSKRVGSFNGSTATGDDVTNEQDYGVLQGWNPLQKCLPRISIFLHGAIQSFSPFSKMFFLHMTHPQCTIWNTTSSISKFPNLLVESLEVSENQLNYLLENMVLTKQLTGNLQLFPWNIEILGWCSAVSVLIPHEEKVHL